MVDNDQSTLLTPMQRVDEMNVQLPIVLFEGRRSISVGHAVDDEIAAVEDDFGETFLERRKGDRFTRLDRPLLDISLDRCGVSSDVERR